MEERILTENIINKFMRYLVSEEKSKNTIEKYVRDITAFMLFLSGSPVTKDKVIEYKAKLISENYAVRSINSMLASLNSLFEHLNWHDLKVKSIKLQRQIYCKEEKELTKSEKE